MDTNKGADTEKTGHTIGRREFLSGAVASGALLMLAGCSAKTSSAPASDSSQAPAEKQAEETVSADFIVIGGGMGGLVAAISAVEAGCSNVVLLEKNAYLGGSTQFAEGVFGSGDRYQQELGFGPYNLNDILMDEVDWSHGVVNRGLLMDAMEDSADYINWLLDKGVTFSTILDAGTGRNVLHIYDGGNGASAVKVLEGVAEKAGVDVRLKAQVTALLQESEAVVGVKADVDGKTVDFRANTVVLATGGMGASTELMDEYTKLDAGKWNYLGDPGATGDAVKLVEATSHGRCKNVCAQNMWITVKGAGVKDTANLVAGMEGSNVWVNDKGVRFCDESIAQQFFVANNTLLNEGAAWSVFDQDHVAFFTANGTTCMWSGFSPLGQPIAGVQEALDAAASDKAVSIVKADTLDDLAKSMGVDGAALKATMETWNASVAAGEDAEFGKPQPFQFPVKTGPFYAANLQSSVLATIGGVRVNRAGQVSSPAGVPIEGLYAAGVVCSGFSGEVYGMAPAGITQGCAVYLGRLAAKAAAERK